jgi:hypothetical protein
LLVLSDEILSITAHKTPELTKIIWVPTYTDGTESLMRLVRLRPLARPAASSVLDPPAHHGLDLIGEPRAAGELAPL